MSHLTISSVTSTFQMNVLAFSSPLYGMISSAQTRTKAVHFPVKVTQPDINFNVAFSSEEAFYRFQLFVRGHQQNVLGVTSLLTLNWPERNINNWTGFISKIQAGAERFVTAPRASFTVDLVDSMVSTRTELASHASSWQAIYGGLGPGSVLTPPSPAMSAAFGNPSVGTASVPWYWQGGSNG